MSPPENTQWKFWSVVNSCINLTLRVAGFYKVIFAKTSMKKLVFIGVLLFLLGSKSEAQITNLWAPSKSTSQDGTASSQLPAIEIAVPESHKNETPKAEPKKETTESKPPAFEHKVTPPPESTATEDDSSMVPEYTIGAEDVLEISVLQPDQIQVSAVVSADGFVSFPYIGMVKVKNLTLTEIQKNIQSRLADGYMKYPIVSVILKESHSRKFFVYGEVNKPGTYPLEENTTVLRAISMAGGFTKYGNSSRVKVLRPRKHKAGYEQVKVNISDVMNGNSDEDLLLNSGDIVVVSEGIF